MENQEQNNETPENVKALNEKYADRIKSGAAIPRENFRLVNVHAKNESTKIVYMDSGNPTAREITDSRKRTPPQQLKDALLSVRYVMGQVLGYDDFIETAKTDSQKMQETRQLIYNQFNILGISLGGSGDNKGVVIKTTKNLKAGGVSAINSGFINLQHRSYGFELQLEEDIERIVDACYEFVASKEELDGVLEFEAEE